MTMLLVYAAALMLAVLLSELAARSVLSTAVLFLIIGFAAGSGGFGLIPLQAQSPEVVGLAHLALFSILFTDGMRISFRDLATAWRLPGRALLFGFPLTLVGTAAAGHWIAGLPWMESLLVAAVLTPTDPVFASAVIGREEIPHRLRHLLNVESGLNDGLALPLVIGFLGMLSSEGLHLAGLGGEVLWGVGLGLLVPWAALHLATRPIFGVHESHRPLFTFAVGMLIFSIAPLTHANPYLAAFTAGITLVTMRPGVKDRFHPISEPLTELLKLGAVLVFGAVLSPRLVEDLTTRDYLFAFVALVIVRPLALAIALYGSPLTWRETLVAGWFGPKGFSSVVYGLMILQHNPQHARHMAHLVGIVIIGSIVAHSSTDVLTVRWFRKRKELPEGSY